MSITEMDTEDCVGDRTVVVAGVPAVLPLSRMIDKLTIHFQSGRKSRGGDVEMVCYPTDMEGVAFVTFYQTEDAERVLGEEQQIMTDNEFPEDYFLTVYPLTSAVLSSVPTTVVNLSIYNINQASHIQSLQSAHRSLHFTFLLEQGEGTAEGPFTAVQALTEDINGTSCQLKLPVSGQTAAVKVKETLLNPGVISHRESVASVSCSDCKAKLEPASSNSLSTLLQTTGEAAQVQSWLSNAKTQNASSNSENLSVRSFYDTDSDEEYEQKAWSRLTKYRTRRAKAKPRQVFREEIKVGIRSTLSGVDLLPEEEISAEHPEEDNVLQKHTRPDRIAAHEIREENDLGSTYSYTDFLKESDRSDSAVTAELLQTSPTDASQSSETDTEDIEELSDSSEDPDASIFVDIDTFRYIEKFEKKEFDRCLRGVDAFIECDEDFGILQVVLKDKPTSVKASDIEWAMKKLKNLVGFWLSTLKCHRIPYDEERFGKDKLIEICKEMNFLFDNVLYIFEDSLLKIIGPSSSSLLFCNMMEDKIAEVKDKVLSM